jgi:hypothetical protein
VQPAVPVERDVRGGKEIEDADIAFELRIRTRIPNT